MKRIPPIFGSRGPAPQLLLLALLAALTAACTDPITVGENLLGDGQIDNGRLIELPVEVRTVRADSILVHRGVDSATLLPVQLLGELEDETFGNASYGFYYTPVLSKLNGLPRTPDYVLPDGNPIDSIVLLVNIDTSLGFYGPGREIPVAVNPLAAPLDATQDYYSTFTAATEGTDVADNPTVTLSKNDRLVHDTIYVAGTNDSILEPHLRFRMNPDYVARFDALTQADYASDAAFRARLPGLHVRPAGPGNGIVALRPDQTGAPASGLYVYFKTRAGKDTVQLINAELFLSNYRRDYGGSLAGELLAGEDADGRALLAGADALWTEIRLTDLTPLEGKIINQANLKFRVADAEGFSYRDYALPANTALYYRDATGNLEPIQDSDRLANAGQALVNLFLGGRLVTSAADSTQRSYAPNLTVHLQRILDGGQDGGTFPPVLYLRVIPTAVDPARAVLENEGSTGTPARLEVLFTNS